MRAFRIRLILVFALIVFAGISSAGAETVWGDLEERYRGVPSIEYNGETLRLKSRITSILLMGIDQREISDEDGRYRVGGQADFQMLVIVDDDNKTITPVQINRDSMVEIDVLNVAGQVSGTRMSQICLAHSFGDGKELSCELAVNAMSRLLLDTPIDCYLSMRLDGIADFNNAIGGVEVTLEDDYSMYDPLMTKGTTLVLNGEQAEIFVRYRYDIGEGSNEYRLERQKVYLEAAMQIIVARLTEDPSYLMTLFDAVDTHCVTDISRGSMLNLANRAAEYEILPIVTLSGETVMGESGYIEFYPDEDSLTQMLAETFYH